MQRRKFIKSTYSRCNRLLDCPQLVVVTGKNQCRPSDTLYVAGFGVGGQRGSDINALTNTQKVKFVTVVMWMTEEWPTPAEIPKCQTV